MTIKKTKKVLEHKLTVQENTETNELSASITVDSNNSDQRTQGQFLVNAINWMLQEQPDMLDELYTRFTVELTKREKELLESKDIQ